jgi:hypothetical protein
MSQEKLFKISFPISSRNIVVLTFENGGLAQIFAHLILFEQNLKGVHHFGNF